MIRIMMDSGAPTIYNELSRAKSADKGQMGSHLKDRKYDDYSYTDTLPFKEYRDKYISLVKTHESNLFSYVNLDIINNQEKSYEMLKYLESQGINPIPVYHFGCDVKWLKKYIEEGYDYIGIGGIVPNPSTTIIPSLDRIWSDILTDTEGYPVVKVHGFAVATPLLATRWPWYCMSEEHNILTKRGFLNHNEIKKGDEVLTFNKNSEVSEWKPVLNIYKYLIDDFLVRFKGRFSAEVTLNHKWLVRKVRKEKGKKIPFYCFKETVDFGAHDQILRCAEHNFFPEKEKYSDTLVKLIAWVVTDGCCHLTETMKSKRYATPKVCIYQSSSVHPEYVFRIRKLLKEANTTFSESDKVEVSGSTTTVFYISGSARREIGAILGNKKELPFNFIFSLTKRQLSLFVEEILMGDGCKRNRVRGESVIQFPQRTGSNTEAFKLALILLGYPISSFSYGENDRMEHVSSSNVKYHTPLSNKYSIDKYKGNVWCIEVENSTFFTKCKGSYYWTGNSADSTSWVKFGLYGGVLIPKKIKGKYDYTKSPRNYLISIRSPAKKKKDGKHINSLSVGEQKKIKEYIEAKGFIFGKSEIKKVSKEYKCGENEWRINDEEVEVVLEEGVSNNHFLRDALNAIFYLDMEKSVPEWPWPFKMKSKRGFRIQV